MRVVVDGKSGLLPKKFQAIDIATLVWILLGLLCLLPLTAWLDISMLLFTFVWLAIPLITLLITSRAATIGILGTSKFGSQRTEYGEGRIQSNLAQSKSVTTNTTLIE